MDHLKDTKVDDARAPSGQRANPVEAAHDHRLAAHALQSLGAGGGLDRTSPTGVVALQRLAGNRAVTQLLSGGGPPAVVQRHKTKNKHQHPHTKSQQKKMQQQQQQKKQPPPQQGVQVVNAPSGGGGILGALGSIGSWLWGSSSGGGDGEKELGELSPLKDKEGKDKVAFEKGDKEEEEPKESFLTQMMNIPKIQIKLENEGEVLGGKGKASGGLSYGAQGGALKGKLEWEKDWIGGEKKPVDTKFSGGKGQLTAKGTLFGGAKAKGEFEGTAQDGKYGSKGKLAAFAGLEAKGETEVVLSVAGKETKFKGAVGAVVGVGGELSYHLTFAEGQLKWGTKGKLALGVGASFEYEMTLPVASITSTMWSWLSSAGSTAWANLTWENLEMLAGG